MSLLVSTWQTKNLHQVLLQFDSNFFSSRVFSGDGESMLHSQYDPVFALSGVLLDLMKATISTKTSLDDSSKINEDTNVNA